MSTFTIKFRCDNAAFGDQDQEIVRILRDIIYRIEGGDSYDKQQTIRDINGNDVGRFGIKRD